MRNKHILLANKDGMFCHTVIKKLSTLGTVSCQKCSYLFGKIAKFDLVILELYNDNIIQLSSTLDQILVPAKVDCKVCKGANRIASNALDLQLINHCIIHEAQQIGAILIVGDDSDLPHVEACMDAGAMGFISHDCSKTVLACTVRLVLNGFNVIPNQLKRSLNIWHNDTLTSCQTKVLQQLLLGHSNKRIALNLHISLGTVKQHLNVIYTVLKVQNRTQAVLLTKRYFSLLPTLD